MKLNHGDQLTVQNVKWLMAQVEDQGLAKRFNLSTTLKMVERGIKLQCAPGTQAAIALNALYLSSVDCDCAQGELTEGR